MRLPTAVLAALLLTACVASAGERVSVRLSGARSVAVGAAWTPRLVVAPAPAGRPSLVARLGSVSRSARVTARGRGRFDARLVLPAAGRWLLTARVGRSTFRLGAVTARAVAQPVVLSRPGELAATPDGRILAADQGRDRLVAIDPATGALTVVAQLPEPYGLERAPSGDIFVSSGNEIRRVDATGRLTTVVRAGGVVGPIAAGPAGEVYFVTLENRIFRLDPANGAVTVVAGTAERGAGGDGGPALRAQFDLPHGLLVAPDGSLLVSDTGNDRIRRVDGRTGLVSTLASGLRVPVGIALAADGSVYVVESFNHRVHRVDPAGRVVPVAGTGLRGSSGDGGPALRAALASPNAVALDPAGALYVAEFDSGHIRRIDPNGAISTLVRR